MFTLDQSETFDWPVKVQVPENGTHVEHTFTARFRRLDQATIDDLLDRGDATFLRDALVGWDGVQENDQDLPFSEEALSRMVNIPEVRIALIAAFFEARRGRHGRRGN